MTIFKYMLEKVGKFNWLRKGSTGWILNIAVNIRFSWKQGIFLTSRLSTIQPTIKKTLRS